MAKLKTRLCARCKRQQKTGNAYCRECNAIRMAEERGKITLPETEEGKGVRTTVDAAFGLMDTVPGAAVEVPSPYGPISAVGNGDGTIVPKLTEYQWQVVNKKLKEINSHG